MPTAPLALHISNLTNLVWLQNASRRSPALTAELFSLSKETVSFYAGLTDRSVEALAAELDVSLFVPRFNREALARLAAALDMDFTRPSVALKLANLRNLRTLREDCQRSIGHAVWIYRIDQETANAYMELDPRRVLELCGWMRVSFFVPRYDAVGASKILDRPAGARAVFAAACESDISPAIAASRRGSTHLTH